MSRSETCAQAGLGVSCGIIMRTMQQSIKVQWTEAAGMAAGWTGTGARVVILVPLGSAADCAPFWQICSCESMELKNRTVDDEEEK